LLLSETTQIFSSLLSYWLGHWERNL